MNPTTLNNPQELDVYKKLVLDFASAIFNDSGINMDGGILNKSVENMIDFEVNLLNITTYNSNNRNSNWSVTTLVQSMNSIDLAKLFSEIVPQDVHKKKFVQDTNFTIAIDDPDYLKRLDGLLAISNKEDIFNYAMWKCAYNVYNYLDTNRFQEIFTIPYNKLSNIPTNKSERQMFCLKNILDLDHFPDVGTKMDKIPSIIYIRKYFHEEDRVETTKMMANLKGAFEYVLKNADWMDPETKSAAMEKLNAMSVNIGYWPFVMDNAKLDSYYSDMNFTNENCFLNMLTKGKIFGFKGRMERLIGLKDIPEYTVNAFYFPDENSIYIPAGILQSPSFNIDFPKAVNYGGAGDDMGHELTHGFDNTGRTYDKNGKQCNWWSNSSSEKFNIKASCMVEQYANYTIPGLDEKVNGILTLGENIADNGGIKKAFAAYKKHLMDLGKPDTKLPGLNVSNEQLFFLSYGLSSCSKMAKSAMIKVLQDSHSPDYLRVNVVLSNIAEFSSAFQCKSGTKMNPEHKCNVW